MPDLAIRVQNLGKRYRIGGSDAGVRTLRETLTGLATAPARRLRALARGERLPGPEHIWALRNVELQVRPGEVLGVIGRNGAGKSTLLKVLARITEPTTGRVELQGRVGSLLEVGTGFHPELTGRENIYLNGSILGMRRTEIERRFDEIVAFAEIARFLDTPVKRYSSGMYVRLAFAVAAHLEPEILLVDEVLAVGDVGFQKKCIGKMGDVASGGRTVLFVSHNLAAVQALCGRTIWLEQGRVARDGPTEEVVAALLASLAPRQGSASMLLGHGGRTRGREQAIVEAWTEDGSGVRGQALVSGQPGAICFRYSASEAIRSPGFGFGIDDQFGRRLFSLNNYMRPTAENSPSSSVAGEARLSFERCPLVPGSYWATLSLVENQDTWVDCVEQAIEIEVQAGDVYGSGKLPGPGQGSVWVEAEVDHRKERTP